MKARHGYATAEAAPEISLSPLIDMVFILLIFFVVATAFVEEFGLPIRAQESTIFPTESRTITIEVTSDLRLYCDGAAVPLASLPGFLKGAGRSADLSVSVKVAALVPTSLMVAVLDACDAGGMRNVSVQAAME